MKLTKLQIKVFIICLSITLITFIISYTMVLYLDCVKCDLLLTDLKRSPISEKYCPGNIFYKLTFILGGIVVVLFIIPLTLFLVKIRKTQEKGNSSSIQFKIFNSSVNAFTYCV